MKKKYFSAFIFLKKAIDHHKKKINIRDLLFLFIRSLFIILILSAASLPILNLSGILSSSSAIFVIDNSLSIKNAFSDIEDYKKSILEISDFYKNENNITDVLYLFSWNGSMIFDRNLDRFDFTNGVFDLRDVEYILEKEPDNNKNIFVITDNQIIDSDYKIPEDYNLIDIFKGWKDNVFVEKIDYESICFYPEKKTIDVFLKNNGIKSKQCEIELYENNRLIDKTNKLIPANKKIQVNFEVNIKKSGINPFNVKIKGDEFKYDNEFSLVFYARDKINIAYTGKTLNPYLEKAFALDERLSPVKIVSVSQANLKNTDILIVNDLSNIKEDIKFINTIIDNGKDIILIPSEPELFNKYLYYNNISPVSLFDSTSGSRKVIADNFISRFYFYNIFFIKDFKKHEVIQYFDDMVPFMVKSSIRDSDVLFLNLTLDRKGSDFVLSPYFVYFWYDIFSKRIEDNVKMYFVDIGTKLFDKDGKKVYKDNPGVFIDDSSNIFIMNFPLRERNINRRIKDLFIKKSDLVKGKINIDFTEFLLFMALMLFFLEIYLKYRWGLL